MAGGRYRAAPARQLNLPWVRCSHCRSGESAEASLRKKGFGGWRLGREKVGGLEVEMMVGRVGGLEVRVRVTRLESLGCRVGGLQISNSGGVVEGFEFIWVVSELLIPSTSDEFGSWRKTS